MGTDVPVTNEHAPTRRPNIPTTVAIRIQCRYMVVSVSKCPSNNQRANGWERQMDGTLQAAQAIQIVPAASSTRAASCCPYNATC